MENSQQTKNKTSKVPKELQDTEKKYDGKDKRRSISVTIKIVTANVLNLLLLVATFYLLSQLPGVGGKIKELKSLQLAAQETTDAVVLNAEIDRNSDKVNELERLFAGDQEFLEFIEAVSILRSEGVIMDVSFPGGAPVVSRSLPAMGAERGFPVVLVFQGSEETINSGLSRLAGLPFLLAPQDVELEAQSAGEEGTGGGFTLRYGALLIVNENFAKN